MKFEDVCLVLENKDGRFKLGTKGSSGNSVWHNVIFETENLPKVDEQIFISGEIESVPLFDDNGNKKYPVTLKVKSWNNS